MRVFYCVAHGKWEVVNRIKEGKCIIVKPVKKPYLGDVFLICEYLYANLDAHCKNKVGMQIIEKEPSANKERE